MSQMNPLNHCRRLLDNYLPRLCLTASNNAIPAATDTFKLETNPDIGIDNKLSQCSRVNRLNPCSSAPKIIAQGFVKSISYNEASPSSARPNNQISSSFKARKVR